MVIVIACGGLGPGLAVAHLLGLLGLSVDVDTTAMAP
jgi:hypothetical protein